MIEDLHRCFFLVQSTNFLILFANFNAKILNYKFQLKVQVHRPDSRTRAISLQCIQRPEKTTDGCKTLIYSLNQNMIFFAISKKNPLQVRREISVIGRRNHDAEQTIKRLRVICTCICTFVHLYIHIIIIIISLHFICYWP